MWWKPGNAACSGPARPLCLAVRQSSNNHRLTKRQQIAKRGQEKKKICFSSSTTRRLQVPEFLSCFRITFFCGCDQ